MKATLVAILIALGLCLAGSDGDYFPWANLGGAVILYVGATLAEYWFRGRG